MRILCFGDSITASASDISIGWVTKLSEYLSQIDSLATVYNLGISGDTAKNLLLRLNNEISARKWSGSEFVLIFYIGANDSVIGSDELSSSPEEYKQNLSEIIKIAKSFSDKIYFLSLAPVDDAQLNPVPWDTESTMVYETERIGQFNDTLKSLVSEHEVSLINIWSIFSGREKELTTDGIHPNALGHRLIAKKVKSEIEEILK